VDYTFVPKEPGQAYISNRLWLPKAKIREYQVKHALEFLVNGESGQEVLRLWEESAHHVVCPREFLPASQYPHYKFPFVDLRPQFSHVEFEDCVVPRDDEQQMAWAALAKNDNGILNLGCGKGKALAHGQPVLTARGYAPIEEVTTYDLVAGTDGRFHKVLGVFPQGMRDIYRVSFTDGTHLDCDADHLWTLVMRRHRAKPVITLTTKELLSNQLRGAAGRNFYLPTIAPVEWQPGTFKVDPYTLGALLGDGHLSRPNRVEFTTADEEMLALMKLPAAHRFKSVPGRHSGKATTYGISPSRSDAQKCERLPEMLDGLGLMGHTAHSKFVPATYKYSSSWERLAVLQGLLDTDGSPTAAGAAEYATVSKQLADDVTDMVLSLGGTCTRQHRVTKLDGKEFPSFRLLVKLPQGMPLFRLSRKLSKLPPSRQREPYRAVESVVHIGQSLATCISVNSSDHLFLAKDYIPTHNTKLAVKKIAQRRTPTLVIVPDGGIYTQWEEAIHGGAHSPVGLRFKGATGNIRGGEFDWENCPVVLALMPSLALKIRDGKVPEEFFRYFGQVIYDEVHITGAPVFSLTAAPFYGDRIGLTATVQREDGLDPIYRYHLGEPFYTNLSQDLVPRIYFWRTPAVIDHKECLRGGTVNISLLRTMLGRDYGANVYRFWAILDAMAQGRKLLCLSHSKDQLRLFHALFPDSGLILGETPQEERTHILRSSQITFAIAKLGSQGVDDPKLDTLFWLTPFRSKIALQQSMGRIQRAYAGKQTPVMVVFEDHQTPPLKGLCTKLRSNLCDWGFKIETHAPSQFPLTFPPEVANEYAAAFAELPPRPVAAGVK
jgi:hypothetical protein